MGWRRAWANPVKAADQLGSVSFAPDYESRTTLWPATTSNPSEAFASLVAGAALRLKPGQSLTVELNDRFGLEPGQPYGFVTVVDVVAGEPN